ncbi:hypothetical protein SADO_05360 [Salinisphaera dokdonensis CL-ES53]|uniref:Uncharacterized protein n=1 Tax=Salinisphaera dokdonensis CL-ES53 TaxID=1304272 RepID=A0ABV2AYD4_9GAMM
MNIAILSRGAALALRLSLLAGACAAIAADRHDHDHGPRHDRYRDHPPAIDVYPGGSSYGLPEIQVFADPATEHWPANYLPDSHRLDGYDGKPDRITDCRGISGRTLSTREQPCPSGQKPSDNARSWSTSP